MKDKSKLTTLPRWMWNHKLHCVVEILKTGHFPNTAMVRLPDDREIEVEVEDLETQ